MKSKRTNTRNPEERRANLLLALQRERYHSVAGLQKKTGIPIATLHRDLDMLMKHGHIRKTYGGVEMLPRGVVREYDKRIAIAVEQKKAIGNKAVPLVKAGDTIFVDASSTVYYFCSLLMEAPPENITIITNAVHLPAQFAGNDSPIRMISTGGTIDREIQACSGGAAVSSIRNHTINKAFISAAGFSLSAGISTATESLHQLITVALASASERYCLVDSSKYGKELLYRIAGLSDFAAVITDDGIAPDVRAQAREKGVTLLTAGV
ncbi:MAG: DeoR/GlpR family DNA-binding transcription regulator [Spirochaetota bacterium]